MHIRGHHCGEVYLYVLRCAHCTLEAAEVNIIKASGLAHSILRAHLEQARHEGARSYSVYRHTVVVKRDRAPSRRLVNCYLL